MLSSFWGLTANHEIIPYVVGIQITLGNAALGYPNMFLIMEIVNNKKHFTRSTVCEHYDTYLIHYKGNNNHEAHFKIYRNPCDQGKIAGMSWVNIKALGQGAIGTVLVEDESRCSRKLEGKWWTVLSWGFLKLCEMQREVQ
jgi:hypothetical protein